MATIRTLRSSISEMPLPDALALIARSQAVRRAIAANKARAREIERAKADAKATLASQKEQRRLANEARNAVVGDIIETLGVSRGTALKHFRRMMEEEKREARQGKLFEMGSASDAATVDEPIEAEIEREEEIDHDDH